LIIKKRNQFFGIKGFNNKKFIIINKNEKNAYFVVIQANWFL